MALTSALMALTLLAPKPAVAQSPVSYKLAGRDVLLEWPKAGTTSLPTEVIEWPGFGFLPSSGRQELAIWATSKDWSSVQDRFNQARGSDPSKTPAWRTKIVVMTRADVLDRGADGLVRVRRSSLESNQVTSALQEIARFAALVTAETGGAVRIEPDVAIENDTLRQELSANARPFDEPFAQNYFRARINGGYYEAEDKVYRGPYNSVIYIHPGLGARATLKTAVNGMPVTGIGLASLASSTNVSPMVDGATAVTMYRAWVEDVKRAAASAGWNGSIQGASATSLQTGLPNPNAYVSREGWPMAASFDAPTPQQLAANRAEARDATSSGSNRPEAMFSPASASPNVVLSVVQDAEKGSVLRVGEIGQMRMGGAAFPTAGNGPIFSLSKTPYLSFWVKSTSREPMALRLLPSGTDASRSARAYFVAIGRDAAPIPGGIRSVVVETAFSPNAKWQRIVADLGPLKEAGLDGVAAISVGPSENAIASERQQLGPIEYDFADISVAAAADGPVTVLPARQPDLNSSDEVARALAVAGSTDGSVLSKALSDPSDLVKINAANALLAHPSGAAVPALIEASHSLNQRLTELALRALWAEGSDQARNEVRRLVKASPLEYTRSVAAPLLSQLKEPTLAGQMVILFAGKSWQARRAGAEAIAGLSGREPQLILMTFLHEDDPEVRLAVTELADPSIDLVAKRMEWSAVNDPSDAVRAASYIKLIQTKNPTYVAEGLKGVSDDSVWVRSEVARYLEQHPDESFRSSVRQAVVNPDPRTRAAALRVFAALEKPVALDEIANVLEDRNAVVQLALIDLALKKNLSLPKGTLDLLRSSPDSEVVEKAKALSG